MKVSSSVPAISSRAAGLDRIWKIEGLEERILLSGIGDGLDLKKAKFLDGDGDKVKIKVSGKARFDITLAGGALDNADVDTITLHNVDPRKPETELSFKIKPAKDGTSDGVLLVNAIVSTDPNVILTGISATDVLISDIDLVGGFNGALVFDGDVGNLTFNTRVESIVIQGGHNLVGDLHATSIGTIILNGGDIIGNITSDTSIDSIQAENIAGNVTAGTTLAKVTLSGDLSGDLAFGAGNLSLLVGGDVTETGSVTGEADAGVVTIDAGGFSRVGVVGDFAGTIDADGAVGLGVGGDLLSTASVSAGNDIDPSLHSSLTVKADRIQADLAASGDVLFAMNNGGFAGSVTAGEDVAGNGTGGTIIIRGGDFTGSIDAVGDVAAMSFLPASGGFSGAITAGGTVHGITTNFFSATASVTASSIGDLTANRANAGNAIANGATFTATDGSIGNITAKALASIAIGGSFTATENIGNISANSSGNLSADHAISGATFIAGISIGTVTASAKAGSGINDSTFTAVTSIGNMTAVSVSGHGFRASADGLNVFTVTDGDLSAISGSSTIGDGIHGGTFTASNNIGAITGTSGSGSGIGDGTNTLATTFTATNGSIISITGSATAGSAGHGGDGIINVEVRANIDSSGVGIGAISGTSLFGTGINNSRFSFEGDIALISGKTNNSNPSIDEDGIFGSTFRTATNIGSIVATTGTTAGAGTGSAIESSVFSAEGSFGVGSGTGGGTSGAVIVDGGDRDEHGFAEVGPDGLPGTSDDVNVNGWKFIEQMVKFANDNSGIGGGKILVIGASDYALSAVQSAAVVLGLEITTVTGADITSAVFSDFSLIYVPSDNFDSAGGVTDDDLALLTARKDEIQSYVNAGGGLVALTEANVAEVPYGWLELPDVLTINSFGGGGNLETLYQTQALIDAGLVVSDEEINNGTPWHNEFTGPGGFNGLVPFVLSVGSDGTAGTADDRVVTLGLAPGSSFGVPISARGDVLDSTFLAGYDIGSNLVLDGTSGDSEEVAATEAVTMGNIQVTGDWINSFAAAGITTTDNIIGNGDDTLSAPGSAIGNVSLSSNIAGDVDNPGNAPLNNFQSDAIANISADAIGIDPNSGSVAAAVEFNTDFINGILGTIGDITAKTTTQRQAIGDGSVFMAGTSIGHIDAVNDNTSFNDLNAIGAAVFEAATHIDGVSAQTNLSVFGTTIKGATFTAHVNDPETGLAIGNIDVVSTGTDSIGNSLFDVGSPTTADTELNIGIISVVGVINGSQFIATGDIARGVRFVDPTYITIGDLNGDNRQDLVIVNEGSDSVAVALGQDGTFGLPTFYAVGDAPVQVVLADVGGSAALDLVVLNSVSDPDAQDSLSILINNGDGTFGAAATLTLDSMSTPTSIVAGDWIEDGHIDLAITDGPGGTVTILEGLGDGQFTEATVSDLEADASPSAIIGTSTTGSPTPPPRSFNADGHIDFAVTNFDSDNISIFLGNVGQLGGGTGTFSTATNFNVGDGPSALAVGSFNTIQDIKLDLVVANQLANTVSVLLGSGTGNFGSTTTHIVGTSPTAVLVTDMNGDSKQDIVVCNSGSNDVSVLLGNGLGGFSAATNFAVGTDPVSMASGDFNGDGFVDIIVTNKGSDSVTVLLGDGTGMLESQNAFTDTSIFGIKVDGSIVASTFTADSDLSHLGSLAAIGGIQVQPGEDLTGLGIVSGSSFFAGSNDETSGLAIGNITIEAEFSLILAIDGSQFTTGSATGLNIGDVTVPVGSVGGFGTTVTATGNIGAVNIDDIITNDATFTSDSDLDDAGDIGAITASSIFDGNFIGHNVALSDTEVTRNINISSDISGFHITASGSIGNFNATGGDITNDVHFIARSNIGDISITKASDGTIFTFSEFFAGQVVAGQADQLGAVGKITVTNGGVGDAMSGIDVMSGAGGIGDITIIAGASGSGITDSRFRAAGTPDATHKADIGNILVTIAAGGPGISNSTFSALGSIGTGSGTADGFNIETIVTGIGDGSLIDSRFLAGYDIGQDLTFDGNVAISDDALGSAISFINKVMVKGGIFDCDIIAGVNPGDDHFGDSDDFSAVQGSSVGNVKSSGLSSTLGS